MKFEIKHRFTGSVIFSLETESLKLCVEAAVKSRANLYNANLYSANLRCADLCSANLRCADLYSADLYSADLCSANLYSADLRCADLCGANLRSANLCGANLRSANLCGANLRSADLFSANLKDTKNLVKLMGVEPGNSYWKRFDAGLNNNGYQFKVGLNELRKGEKFADDERKICSSPGFHFASRSWCAAYYPDRPLEARIYLPTDAKINEPWATDGKASADKIFILQVFDVKTGEDVTEKYR